MCSIYLYIYIYAYIYVFVHHACAYTQICIHTYLCVCGSQNDRGCKQTDTTYNTLKISYIFGHQNDRRWRIDLRSNPGWVHHVEGQQGNDHNKHEHGEGSFIGVWPFPAFFARMWRCLYGCVCLCVCVYVYVCTWVCMHVYIYMCLRVIGRTCTLKVCQRRPCNKHT